MKFIEWLKGIPSLFWKSLEQKGKYTSLMGIYIVFRAIYKPLIEHNKGIVFEDGYLIQALYFVVAGVILIILPSYIKISKDGVEVKD